MSSEGKFFGILILFCVTLSFLLALAVNKSNISFNNNTASKVVQAYNEINSALYKAQNEKGDFNDWSSKSANDEEKLMTFMQNLNIEKKKDCGMNDKSGECWWSESLINYDRKGKTNGAKYYYTFTDKHNNAVYVNKDNHWGFLMIYDVNGKNKGPNERGKDIFYFQTGPDNIEFVPGGEDQLASNSRLRRGCFKYGVCEAWVIRTGNTEYMKADSKGICPSGKQLSWFNTTCN